MGISGHDDAFSAQNRHPNRGLDALSGFINDHRAESTTPKIL
jgi:hypothetical protein